MTLFIKRFLAAFIVAIPLLSSAAEPLNINNATAEQLAMVMSGVGDSKAEAIVAYREANGPFESIEQLVEVKGIGPALLNKNRVLIQAKQDQ